MFSSESIVPEMWVMLVIGHKFFYEKVLRKMARGIFTEIIFTAKIVHAKISEFNLVR